MKLLAYDLGIIVDSPFGSSLRLMASMSCPGCNTITKIKPENHHISAVALEDDRVRPDAIEAREAEVAWAVSQLASRHDCEHCGITSAMPKKQQEEFQSNMEARITANWLKEETERTREAWLEIQQGTPLAMLVK